MPNAARRAGRSGCGRLAVVSAGGREGVIARRRRAGALALMEGAASRANRPRASPGCVAPRSRAIAEAAALIGDLYAKGGALPPNYAEAAMWFRRAAEAGHRTAARALGMLYLTGAGVGRDSEEAARMVPPSPPRRAIQTPQADLANLLLHGFGEEDDGARTREWFEQAAASGDLVAAFNFGVCLAEGVGVDRDDRKAAEWMRRAADGVVNAQYWYGRMLVEGRGIEADPGQGRAWIERAAAVGMPEAEVALAELKLLSGRGGPRDHPGALDLFSTRRRPRPCRCDVLRRRDARRRP